MKFFLFDLDRGFWARPHFLPGCEPATRVTATGPQLDAPVHPGVGLRLGPEHEAIRRQGIFECVEVGDKSRNGGVTAGHWGQTMFLVLSPKELKTWSDLAPRK